MSLIRNEMGFHGPLMAKSTMVDAAAEHFQQTFGEASNTTVGTFVIFWNGMKTGLGIPMPKGRVRVSKLNEDGKEPFIGEDQIDHTPKDEEMPSYLGDAIDIVGEGPRSPSRPSPRGMWRRRRFELRSATTRIRW